MSTNANRSPEHTTRILVVEDDAAVLMMLAEVLRDQGYCIASAATPEQARRYVATFRPQIVVIGTDGRGTFARGWHLAAGLRQKAPELPLIMVSTSDAAVAEVGMTERGRLFDAALLKPFRIRELVTHIQCLLPLSVLDEPWPGRSRVTAAGDPIAAPAVHEGEHDPVSLGG